jgi:RNA polymerase sigma-70 factor (family 1)
LIAQNQISDDELLTRLKSGDEHAFDQMFRAFYPGLCFFARKYVSNYGVAEEIVQDILFKLWQRRTDFDNYSSLKGFLYISTKNACLDSIDKEHRKLNRENSWYLDSNKLELDVEENIIYAEVLMEISQALDQLPGQCRKIMKMSYEQGLSGKEIAAAMQLTVSTVNNQKARGIAILRKILNPNSFTILLVLLQHHDHFHFK